FEVRCRAASLALSSGSRCPTAPLRSIDQTLPLLPPTWWLPLSCWRRILRATRSLSEARIKRIQAVLVTARNAKSATRVLPLNPRPASGAEPAGESRCCEGRAGRALRRDLPEIGT